MKKLLVVGVIVLFLGMNVIPSTGHISQYELEYELKGGFGIKVIVTNNGSEYFKGGIFCNHTTNGPLVLTKNGSGINLIRIEPGETFKLTKILIIALGSFTTNVNLTAGNTTQNIYGNGFALGFFVILFNIGDRI